METKGNPVDSVIQYQLHRKTEGGGSGDFECKFNGVKLIEQVDSDEYELTQEYYNSLSDFQKYLVDFKEIAIDENITIKWVNINLKPSDFINKPFIDFIFIENETDYTTSKCNGIYYSDNIYTFDAGVSYFSDGLDNNFINVIVVDDK